MITSQLQMTGFSLGILHVLAGPDHLSALATLSVGNSWKAMELGVRWGLGHSTGLVVVAAIFIYMKGEMDLSRIGRFSNVILGIFMITIGFYGVIGALKTFGAKRTKRDLDLDPSMKSDSRDIASPSMNSSQKGSSTFFRMNSDVSHSSRGETFLEAEEDEKEEENKSFVTDCFGGHDHDHYDHVSNVRIPLLDMHDTTTQKVVSFAIGVLHGVAGPGAILGVLPAVEMQSWRASTCYLGSFVVASTISMGAFAALYGEITKRMGSTAESVELGLRIFSSSLSIVVGMLWLVLSMIGKLDSFFH